MLKDPTQFRERFKRWKEGMPAYKNGKPIDDEWNPNDTYTADAGMIKSKIAIDSHFGNPTMRRIANYDGRDYIFPNQYYEVFPGIYEQRKGNVYLGSHDDYIVPGIQDVDGQLLYIELPRINNLSIKFPRMRDAWSFGENYKKYAPMMKRYSNGKPILPLFEGGKDSYRYYQDGQGGWFRAANDDMTRAFEGLVVTPNGINRKFISESLNNTELTIKARDEYNAAHSPFTGLPMNQGLEIVSPEFDLIGLAPLVKAGAKYLGKKTINNIADKLGFFVLKPGTYTRGIGMTDAGLNDAIETGVFRGNPRGTEQTAKIFDKMFLKNRNNFRDIVEDTGIEGIESRYLSRTLTQKDFDALKEAAKKYENTSNKSSGISLIRQSSDPLSKYSSYKEYLDDVNSIIAKTELMPNRIASGEVQVNTQLSEPMLFEDESGRFLLPQGKPITERFGPNSDYLADGTPLSYWYADGRNPLTKGHAYARSNYGVRVNNPEDYIPFMHELHLHPSLFKSPKLLDPNVEVFRKWPFGITLRMNKNKLLKMSHNINK